MRMCTHSLLSPVYYEDTRVVEGGWVEGRGEALWRGHRPSITGSYSSVLMRLTRLPFGWSEPEPENVDASPGVGDRESWQHLAARQRGVKPPIG